jgi:type I restriction enzyme S subunit
MLIDNNEAQTVILPDIRDTLLPKLLSGEIRAKDAEKFVEKAA